LAAPRRQNHCGLNDIVIDYAAAEQHGTLGAAAVAAAIAGNQAEYDRLRSGRSANSIHG
jgi:hypothetical protein